MSTESFLEEFVLIAELGSVSAAARHLQVPRASVSRRLARLEAELGTQLMHREPGRQQLTQAGLELYQRGRKLVSDLKETLRAVASLDGVPRGLLRVGMPQGAGIEVFIAERYLAAYPEVQLEFVGHTEHDDLLTNSLHVAVRTGTIEDEALMGRKLVSFRSYPYASPTFLNDKGPCDNLKTLSTLPAIVGFDSQMRPLHHWPCWDGGQVPVRALVRTNNLQSHLDAALRGLGVALLSERIVRHHVSSGRLVSVLPDLVGMETPVSLVWPASEFLEPKVRAFIDLCTELIPNMAAARDLKDKIAAPA